MKPYTPLGILSISAYIEAQGFKTEVFDSTFRSLNEFENYVAQHLPPVVGIYINMMTKFTALKMIAIAKKHGATVIIGGPEPAFYAKEFLGHGADIIVVGEGEVTVTDLMKKIRSGKDDLRTIDGIIFQNDHGDIIHTAPRKFIDDIDSLPFPDRSKIDLHEYIHAWNKRHHNSSLSVISMRGCPFTCKWCSHAVYGESYRRLSPKLFVDEIKLLMTTYKPDAFWFADDVFTINHKWFFEFEKELKQRNLSIKYECITRADRMNEDVIQSLKATGCFRLWIGSESGSQRILDAMSRGVKVEQIQSMTRLAQRHGIEVGMFLMLGYQNETVDDIEKTIEHVKSTKPDLVLTTLAYPIKGTKFYEEIKDHIQLPKLEWSEWNDRMIDMRHRYPKRFYWFANRRVINEATVSRMVNGQKKKLRTLATSFIKAKVAQAGMYLTR